MDNVIGIGSISTTDLDVVGEVEKKRSGIKKGCIG